MKHAIYLILATILGVLLSGIAHAVIEILYLNNAISGNSPVVWRYYLNGAFPCSLPPILFYGLPVLGIIGGFLMGRTWWRWVYVEGKHWRKWHHQP